MPSLSLARPLFQAPPFLFIFEALALGAPDRKVAFSVPTGNFGNVFAGYAAVQMGLPIERLIVASNHNDILPRFFEAGTMVREPVVPSLSPSMDIQVSSNFERLLFEILERDGAKTKLVMDEFAVSGQFTLNVTEMSRVQSLFSAYRLDDSGTIAEIASTAENDGMIMDPHSAVGLSAARRARADGTVASNMPIISLACAHPAKFEAAVKRATGTAPNLPPHIADLMTRPERMQTVACDSDVIKALILAHRRSA